ncbi:ferritin-like domain-containing protein [Natronorubrum sp. DTA7]|uniref:ferritin-like domain-containing protein n=1 Tax=Natronorubrum sp. DTA7 TaxID=3447016 RepID=UPI003F83F218
MKNTDKKTIQDPTTDSTSERSTSRRRVLAASAVLSAGAAGVAPMVSAHDHDDYENDGEAPKDDAPMGDEPPEAVPDEFENDIEILNYARTLELLEAEFYTQGLQNIDDATLQQQFEELGPIQDRVVDRLQVVRDHEVTHADVLGQTVEMLGGEPVASPEFDFGTAVEQPDEFVATGALLEDVGVSAYAGAAPSIENADLVPPALSIHSVEARHASFLRELNGEIGFPVAFDQPRSRSEVLELASGFIVG